MISPPNIRLYVDCAYLFFIVYTNILAAYVYVVNTFHTCPQYIENRCYLHTYQDENLQRFLSHVNLK